MVTQIPTIQSNASVKPNDIMDASGNNLNVSDNNMTNPVDNYYNSYTNFVYPTKSVSVMFARPQAGNDNINENGDSTNLGNSLTNIETSVREQINHMTDAGINFYNKRAKIESEDWAQGCVPMDSTFGILVQIHNPDGKYLTTVTYDEYLERKDMLAQRYNSLANGVETKVS